MATKPPTRYCNSPSSLLEFHVKSDIQVDSTETMVVFSRPKETNEGIKLYPPQSENAKQTCHTNRTTRQLQGKRNSNTTHVARLLSVCRRVLCLPNNTQYFVAAIATVNSPVGRAPPNISSVI